MSRLVLVGVVVSSLLTVASLGVWWATDRHAYTKFQVVVQEEVAIDEDDPFAAAGFFDGDTETRTVTRDEFHLGLIPVPQGLFDKHALSVASLSGPPWLATIALAFWLRWRRKRAANVGAAGATPN